MALVTRGSVDYEVELLAVPSEEKPLTFDWDDVEVSAINKAPLLWWNEIKVLKKLIVSSFRRVWDSCKEPLFKRWVNKRLNPASTPFWWKIISPPKKTIDETNSNQWTLLEVPVLKTSKLRPLTDSPSWNPWMTGSSPKSRVQQVTGMLMLNVQNYTQAIYRQVSDQLEMSDSWI